MDNVGACEEFEVREDDEMGRYNALEVKTGGFITAGFHVYSFVLDVCTT